jgi:uncharacterized membrane protein
MLSAQKRKSRRAAGFSWFVQFIMGLATLIGVLVGVLALTIRVLLLLARLLAAAALLLTGLLTRVLVLLARVLILIGHQTSPLLNVTRVNSEVRGWLRGNPVPS